MEAPLNVLSLKLLGGAWMETADAAAARPALTMRVMLFAVRMGESVEDAMLVEALEETEIAVAEGADNDGLLGGFLDASNPHRPEGGALAPKPISVGRREAVVGCTGTVTAGGTGQPPETPGGRELWAWLWAMKLGLEICSWE